MLRPGARILQFVKHAQGTSRVLECGHRIVVDKTATALLFWCTACQAIENIGAYRSTVPAGHEARRAAGLARPGEAQLYRNGEGNSRHMAI